MKSFKKYIDEMGGGAVAAGPTNTASSGAVAGIGVGKDGEPGVNMKKRKSRNPIILPMGKRK
jgi:hypothetical protein